MLDERLASLELEYGDRRVFAMALHEQMLRGERKRQRDHGGLLHFIRYFWDILEPSQDFAEGWALEAMCLHLEAVHHGYIRKLLINVPPGSMKSLLCNVFFPVWQWTAGSKPTTRFLSFSYAAHLTHRDNDKMLILMQHPRFKELWPKVWRRDGKGRIVTGDDGKPREFDFKLREQGKEKVGNTLTGWKLATSVGGVGTGERGDCVLLDDPHNVKDDNSEVVRPETVRWFKEAMSNRLNNMDKSAIIVIMQRTHEADVAGVILEEKLGYVHLNIPLHFEVDRKCTTRLPGRSEIFWEDPRIEDGENFWDARFTENAINDIMQLGDHVYCTPAESPVLMADLTMRPIAEVREGDVVVGFTVPGAGRNGTRFSKRKLVPARVGNVTRSVRPVVRVTLDSGRVIRCTEDHMWYMRRSPGSSHEEYLPAKVGRTLHRVCDPELPIVSPEDQRDAGWLGGFFDAEGTVSIMKKHDHYEPSTLISFVQGDGRNLPLCENLERVLTKFGFEWTLHEREQREHQNHRMRQYWLRGDRVPLHQRFMHVAQPLKWRERIIGGAYGTAFCIGKEKVVSIEPDGTEEVFGLTTETGNYVVWGLASKNCGQYQQRPEPRGGGLFKRAYWQDYEPHIKGGQFPKLHFILASLDPAFTEKEENDPCGFSCWGIFSAPDGSMAAILLVAWRKHLLLNGTARKKRKGESWGDYKQETETQWGVVQWVRYECQRFKVHKLLVENKGGGQHIGQELITQSEHDAWALEMVDPGRLDKLARGNRVQPVFSEGLVWCIKAKAYAKLIIDEMASFPRGRFKDITDSATQALWWLRIHGFLQASDVLRTRQYRAAQRAGKQPARGRKALYPV